MAKAGRANLPDEPLSLFRLSRREDFKKSGTIVLAAAVGRSGASSEQPLDSASSWDARNLVVRSLEEGHFPDVR
jgi:hypothetical protein